MLMEKDETDTNVGQRGMRWQEVTAISPPSANVPTKFSSKNISLEKIHCLKCSDQIFKQKHFFGINSLLRPNFQAKTFLWNKFTA